MYVELKDVCKRFGAFAASSAVSFSLREGSLAALLGPSGSGKTTILRLIAGLETPDSGDIHLGRVRVNDVSPSQRGIGFVFQNYALFRYMTVFDNIAFGLTMRKERSEKIKARVSELLRLVGLEGLDRRYPAQLSGGQKQRVAFARALAPHPRLLLLDEPFAAIDAQVRGELRLWLREMISRLKITSIFVTHDQAEAIEVADEIIITNQGKIEQRGSPVDLYRNPSTPFVAGFIGESTTISGFGALKGFETAQPGEICAIRPEFIKVYHLGESLQYEGATEDAVVESLAFQGDSLRIGLRLKGFLLMTDYSLEQKAISRGDRVKALIYRVYAFNGERVSLLNNKLLNAHADGYSFDI